MNGFKDKLKRELRQDAPFTEDVKQRLLQPKQEKPKRNWRVAVVSAVACCLAVLLFSTVLFPQNDALRRANSGKELLPIVETTDGEVIEPETAHLLGEQWMLHFLPMVVEKGASVTYGDYVAYYTPTGIVVSTVLGLAQDTVRMEDGQVTVDETVLTVRGLGEKVGPVEKKDPFQNPYYFYSWGIDRPFINETIETVANELIVYSNEEGHRLRKITEAQLIGKVTAIYNTEQLAFHLTPDEQALYDAFKTDYNVEHLRDVSPVGFVKMFLLSEVEKDFETYEALFTTVEDHETREVKKYDEKTKRVREEMFTREVNELVIANTFNGLANAQFEQESETNGWVVFTNRDGTTTKAGMKKNEAGIWQPAFSRAVYFPLE
ncbi:MAG: hypothetical protein ABS948_14720 [Solibacillus sp.]